MIHLESKIPGCAMPQRAVAAHGPTAPIFWYWISAAARLWVERPALQSMAPHYWRPTSHCPLQLEGAQGISPGLLSMARALGSRPLSLAVSASRLQDIACIH